MLQVLSMIFFLISHPLQHLAHQNQDKSVSSTSSMKLPSSWGFFGCDNCCKAVVTLRTLQCCLSNYLTSSPPTLSCFVSPWLFYLQEAALPETTTPRKAKESWGVPKSSAEKDSGATQVNNPAESRRCLRLGPCSWILRVGWILSWEGFGHKGVGQGDEERQPPARQGELGDSREIWIQTDFFSAF